MDIRENIYLKIREREGIGYPESEKVAEELSHASAELLIQDMDQFYTNWFNIQKAQELSFDEENAKLEYIQETSFEIVCKALALQGDPEVIPYFLKYVPVDGPKHANGQVVMEDYNSQDLEECITSVKYYGEFYIPVLLAHIHELMPDKIESADNFLYQMMLDDLHYFKDNHPLFNNLHLARQGTLAQLVEYAVVKTLKEVEEDYPEKLEYSKKILNIPLKKVSYEDKPIIKISYLRQQFLKLHASD
jgi:hypothetical protein